MSPAPQFSFLHSHPQLHHHLAIKAVVHLMSLHHEATITPSLWRQQAASLVDSLEFWRVYNDRDLSLWHTQNSFTTTNIFSIVVYSEKQLSIKQNKPMPIIKDAVFFFKDAKGFQVILPIHTQRDGFVCVKEQEPAHFFLLLRSLHHLCSET